MTVLQVTKSTTDHQELLENLTNHAERIETVQAQYALAVSGKSLPIIYQSEELRA